MLRTDCTTACAVCPPSADLFGHRVLWNAINYKPRPSKLCAGCRNIRYCSRAHQKLDWSVHKHVCKQFRKLEPPPSPELIRVIYLPVDKTEPEFRYVSVGTKTSQDVPDCASEFDLDQPLNTWRQRCTRGCRDDFEEGILHVQECYGIYVFTHEDTKITTRDTRPNRCIEQLTNGEIAQWRGPVLAFGRRTSGSNCRDLDTTDFKVIVDQICRSVRFKDSNIIRGVRINCDGHVKVNKQPQFEAGAIRVRASMPENKLDLPRLVFGYSLRILLLQTENNLDARNPMASLLNLACGNGGKPWGYYKRQKWGDCFVMREDGKPLAVEDLKAFCNWVDKDVRKRFNTARKITTQAMKMINTGDPWPKIEQARNEVLDMITLQRFCDFSRSGMVNDLTDAEMPNDNDEGMEDDNDKKGDSV